MNRFTRTVLLVLTLAAFLMGMSGITRAEEVLVSNIFYDTYIIDALSDISAQTGVSIIADATVSGYISMDLTDIPLEEALRRICLPYGYTFRRMEEGYYLVGAADPKNPTFPLLTDVEVIEAKYLKADVIYDLLSEFYKSYINVDSETNTLVVTSSPDIINYIKKDIEKIDIPVPQIMLEVIVCEITSDGRRILGTDWQWNSHTSTGPLEGALNFSAKTLTTSLGLSYANGIEKFLISLQALVKDGEANIHANPRIVTLDGQPANIFLGDEQILLVNVESENGSSSIRQSITVKSGVTLNFLPNISPDGHITIKIEPEVSTVTGTNSSGFPIVSKRKASTTIRLLDGETFILGGLLQDIETRTTSKVPLLGDIPLLGKIFTKEQIDKQESEVIILVTPFIIDEEGENVFPYEFQPAYSKEFIEKLLEARRKTSLQLLFNNEEEAQQGQLNG